MASIASLPFYRRRFSHFWAKSLEANVVFDSLAGNSEAVKLFCDRLIAGWNRRQPVRPKPLREMSTSGERGDESEESRDPTIQRSKKVLQVQRELLQHIAERRKLVTSMKNSVPGTWEDEDSNEEDNSDSANISTENVAGLWNGGIMSSSSEHLALEDEAEISTKYRGNEKNRICPWMSRSNYLAWICRARIWERFITVDCVK